MGLNYHQNITQPWEGSIKMHVLITRYNTILELKNSVIRIVSTIPCKLQIATNVARIGKMNFKNVVHLKDE